MRRTPSRESPAAWPERIGRRLAAFGAAIVVVAAGGILALRAPDARADATLGSALVDAATARPEPSFEPAMVADLPEPARRFFLFAITPGAPLRMASKSM